VIVSTIFFTFWFSRPLLRRHRRGSMLEARGLTKRYGGLLAPDAVSFILRPC